MALGTKVGDIFLDLNINKKGFQTQLGSIGKLATKAGATIAAAFSVKKIIDFGKACIDLGSDLAEVQNVVDVTFPHMTKTIDEFASGAAAKFGLSETMAKKFTGTFGSMAEAFGFSEKQAADMATTLTGLAGDVASFYNISQDEAYTKLKSVFSGETETLKDLGIVMTQSALDAYALANGYGKVTSKMTEAEKVSLRYAFVQSQLTNAAGDFARTSDSWANQVRLLSLQFDSLRASIGQGLINVLTPVIKWLNVLIGKLAQAAKAFASFTSLFSKKKSSGAGAAASAVASNISKAATSASNLGTSAGKSSSGLSKAAKAAKKLKRELAGFDQITKLGDEDSDTDAGSSGGSGGSGAGGSIGDITDGITASSQESASAIDKAFSPVFQKLKEGFQGAFKADPKQLLTNLDRIKKANQAVWQSKEVQSSIENFKLSAAKACGAVVGSAASVAVSFEIGVSGGIAKAKEDLEAFNKTKISSIFDNMASLADKITDLSGGFATIGKAFEGKGFQKIVEVAEKVFNVTVLNNIDLFTGLLSDLVGSFRSVSDNADGFKQVLEDIFDIVGDLLSPIGDLMDFIAENSKKYEDSAIHKFFDQLNKIHSAGVGKTLKVIHNGLQKVKEKLETKTGKAATSGFDLGSVLEYFTGKKKFKRLSLKWEMKNKQRASDMTKEWQKLTAGVKDKTASIKAKVATKWNSIAPDWKKITSNIQDKTAGMKAKIATRWNEISSGWCNITNNIKDKQANMRAKILTRWNEISSSWYSITNNIQDKWGNMKARVLTKWSDLKWHWQNLLSNFKDKTCNIALKFSAAAQDLKKWINTNVIDKVNSKFKYVPILKKHLIPHLAQGGYVKANTPQLALIGDNRHQGEVVAPENKMIEMAKKAAELSSSGGADAEIVSLLRQILALLKSLDLVASIDGNSLKQIIVKLINDHTRATGMCEIEF